MERTPAETKIFMKKLCDEFSTFVQDSIDEGADQGFEDHMEFLQAAMETFITTKEESVK